MIKAVMKKIGLKTQEKITGWMFVLPLLAGFIAFHLLPILFSFFISFMGLNDFGSMMRFANGDMIVAGLRNYSTIFTDKVAIESFLKTLYFMLFYVPTVLIAALILANLLNTKFFLRGLTRSMILIPYVANIVAVAMVFSVLLEPKDGVINTFIRTFGISNPPDWLGSQFLALPTLAVVSAWNVLAYPAIVYLAALQGVPVELYEAATVDGANLLQRFKNITFPMISPTTFFLIVTLVLDSFKNYALIKSMTNGGPGMATRTIVFNIYEDAFSFNKYSYAAAESTLLFIVILVITLIQWKGQKKWVHY